jgi:hypothetical protein
VLCFDALAFTTGAFVERPDYGELLLSALVSKAFWAFGFAVALGLVPASARAFGTAQRAPNHPLREFFHGLDLGRQVRVAIARVDEIERGWRRRSKSRAWASSTGTCTPT